MKQYQADMANLKENPTAYTFDPWIEELDVNDDIVYLIGKPFKDKGNLVSEKVDKNISIKRRNKNKTDEERAIEKTLKQS